LLASHACPVTAEPGTSAADYYFLVDFFLLLEEEEELELEALGAGAAGAFGLWSSALSGCTVTCMDA
jgi:hypothetical protein